MLKWPESRITRVTGPVRLQDRTGAGVLEQSEMVTAERHVLVACYSPS
jgi:hypothetical protein